MRLSSSFSPLTLVFGMSLLVAMFCLIPPLYLFIRVSDDWSHARDIVLASGSITIILETFALVLVTTFFAMCVGLICAWLTEYTDFPYPTIFRLLFALPLAVPTYVGAIVMISLFSPVGFVNDLLSVFGLGQFPLIYGFWGSVFVLTLFTYPYVYLIIRPALLGIDRGLLENSRLLGRSGWYTFRHIILPLLRNALGSSGLLVALYVLADFGSVSLLRFNTLTMLIFIEYDGALDRVAASATSILLMAFAAVLVIGMFRFRGNAARGGLRSSRRAYRVRLGVWQIPAGVFSLLIIAFTLVAPVVTLLSWLIGDANFTSMVISIIPPLFDNILVGAVAAIVTTMLALPIAHITVRNKGAFLTRPIEILAYSGYALPGIVVGLGLGSFGLKFDFLYQSAALLIIAYALLFLPQALNAEKPVLINIRPALQEAAASLGKNRRQTFRQITLPLMSRGLLASCALVFLTTLKELPATVLLSPIGFESLALRIWMGANEGFFADAALPSLLLILSSGVALYLAERNLFRLT